ncbi:DUF4974 domain-containing protein [Aureibaculum sp. 2210JD6-5]|uniref:FecR family protein n=1 Tax=Aureibaculum sp. 2210JD6-5 TaxID=3103957 RepID=UPI002AACA51F|nr:FecR domain-containing protein [Aureibaculum sp. 2210JD6-5]MDY7396754.1 DUF4974 domain-containing protein [Aureibaculum sp. 2210JD6-5]
MGKSKIELIIIKFLNNEAGYDDLKILDFWLGNTENLPFFNRFVKTNHITNLCMSEFNVEEARLNIKRKLKERKRKTFKKNFYKTTAVAVLAFLLSVPFWYNTTTKNLEYKTVEEKAIVPGTNKAILTLEDGKQITIEEDKNFATNKVYSDGKGLVYTKKQNDKITATVEYNYITVPRGGEFYVELSDGTQVWLNSASKLKYPVSFVKGKTRVVELLYGEAYFDVSPSSKNNNSKFKVTSNLQDIEVLGTKFNINAYQDEEYIITTLVEGKVLVKNLVNNNFLTPRQQAIMNIDTGTIEVLNDVNISEVIAWKNGIFSFKNMALKDIMKTLSRWYDVHVIFTNPEIESVEFTGVLGKEQSIEEILLTIANPNDLIYEIKDKTIIFK